MSATQDLKDSELIQTLKFKVDSERLLAVEILELLQQVQDRLLHLKMGYPSLLAFCVQELKYSESTAYRRISALRLSADVPELKEQLQSGELTFQAVAQVQTFLNQEKKQNRKVYSLEEKQDLVRQVQHKNTRQIEQLLAEKSPGLAKPETSRQVTSTLRQVTITISVGLDSKLEELRSLYSHKNPNPSLAELIEIMADEVLRRQEDRQQRAHKRFAARARQQPQSYQPESHPHQPRPQAQAQHQEVSNEKPLPQRMHKETNGIDGITIARATRIAPKRACHSSFSQSQSRPQSQSQSQSQQTPIGRFSNEKSLRQEMSESANSADGSTTASSTTASSTTASSTTASSTTASSTTANSHTTAKIPLISHPLASTHSHKGRSNSRYISATVRYELRMRYRGRCCYVDSLTGQRCESRHQLEVEHIVPVAYGGSNDIANLRLTCRNHNVYYAAQSGLSWPCPLRYGSDVVKQ